MHRGKGMKFVGDSRVPATREKFIPKDYSEYPGKTEPFWPNFLLKEWLVGAVFLIGFLTLTIVAPSPLEKEADPTDAAYIPLPDWYFLFLYQFLKYDFASGDYVVIGTVVIPGLAFGALLLAPFLDKGKGRRPHQRPIAVSMMLIGVISIIWLTYEAVAHVNWEERAEMGKIVEEVEIDQTDPGYEIYSNQSCINCHGGNLEGSPAGPTLVGTGLTADEIADIAVNGVGGMPAGQFNGSDEELQQLAEFIASYSEEGGH
ncbi:menaquinol-cytochrome c reductase cytochrome b/c subunit [Melghiribacillus thermohalophilus]|uniref:Menaquinol-cytochrome c reductase cytochrome b/c subunit n=1 Tax=Melghiribacillus thermohalophilus TaxID=1324956 RepID=A0A4R3N879_9BACI|nr:menaquinol-cytochrome c reductase cytochrome b/c subunit [Melghiribacillus thermohalophilus]TCT25563.1 menaquinol-cytochrome c reductase cytochrome b/c subunit [Melghiribacillus thermohalophilus]